MLYSMDIKLSLVSILVKIKLIPYSSKLNIFLIKYYIPIGY